MAAKFGVKNRAPAAIQITAEQLLREAHDRGGGSATGHARRQRSQITDPDELREYRMTQRKGFEDAIRMNRVHLGNYVKYAKWEEAQEAFERARSVFERALDVDHRSQSLWLKYAEMEMRNKFVNHARNVWDRATAILPRVDQFWYKYTFMEEMVENHAACRAVFERWMAWEPDDRAWHAYAAFEERRGDARRARAVLERFVACHPRLPSYLKYARWEERQQQPTLARDAYERALRELGQWEFEAGEEAALYRAFARFEERQREHGRARAILVHACATLDRDAHADVHADLLAFEKKHGAVDAVERQVAEQRRSDYEARVRDHPRDYDAWFDLLRLEEARFRATGDAGRCRAAYARACAQAPPVAEKRYWRRYVYLWLGRAAFEEVDVGDVAAARAALRAALDAVPHAAFTFAKLWLAAADLEVRAKDLGAARRLLGEALGRCRRHAKAKLYRGYASLERRLGEVDRCRRVYGAWVEAAPGGVSRRASRSAPAQSSQAARRTSARARTGSRGASRPLSSRCGSGAPPPAGALLQRWGWGCRIFAGGRRAPRFLPRRGGGVARSARAQAGCLSCDNCAVSGRCVLQMNYWGSTFLQDRRRGACHGHHFTGWPRGTLYEPARRWPRSCLTDWDDCGLLFCRARMRRRAVASMAYEVSARGATGACCRRRPPPRRFDAREVKSCRRAAPGPALSRELLLRWGYTSVITGTSVRKRRNIELGVRDADCALSCA